MPNRDIWAEFEAALDKNDLTFDQLDPACDWQAVLGELGFGCVDTGQPLSYGHVLINDTFAAALTKIIKLRLGVQNAGLPAVPLGAAPQRFVVRMGDHARAHDVRMWMDVHVCAST